MKSARDARWLAQALDPRHGLVRLVEMDARGLSRGELSRRPHAPAVRSTRICCRGRGRRGACPAMRARDARWIFHIGHVGSTLVARLLGELDGVLADPRAADPARPAALPGRAARARFVPAIADAAVAHVRGRRDGAGQGDQLRQRDRRRAGAAGRAGAVPVPPIRAPTSRPSSPARIRCKELHALAGDRAPAHGGRGVDGLTATQRRAARGGGVGVRNDRARSRGGGDARSAHAVGRFRPAARRHGGGLGADRRHSSASQAPAGRLRRSPPGR